MSNLDTMAKRASGMNPASPWRGPMVFSFISFAVGDRQAADYMYSGISSSTATTAVIAQFRSVARGIMARVFGRVN